MQTCTKNAIKQRQRNWRIRWTLSFIIKISIFKNITWIPSFFYPSFILSFLVQLFVCFCSYLCVFNFSYYFFLLYYYIFKPALWFFFCSHFISKFPLFLKLWLFPFIIILTYLFFLYFILIILLIFTLELKCIILIESCQLLILNIYILNIYISLINRYSTHFNSDILNINST